MVSYLVLQKAAEQWVGLKLFTNQQPIFCEAGAGSKVQRRHFGEIVRIGREEFGTLREGETRSWLVDQLRMMSFFFFPTQNGCFLKWWYPQKHPKMIIFSRKTQWLLGTTISGNHQMCGKVGR